MKLEFLDTCNESECKFSMERMQGHSRDVCGYRLVWRKVSEKDTTAAELTQASG